jgi:hypothetical protein
MHLIDFNVGKIKALHQLFMSYLRQLRVSHEGHEKGSG